MPEDSDERGCGEMRVKLLTAGTEGICHMAEGRGAHGAAGASCAAPPPLEELPEGLQGADKPIMVLESMSTQP